MKKLATPSILLIFVLAACAPAVSSSVLPATPQPVSSPKGAASPTDTPTEVAPNESTPTVIPVTNTESPSTNERTSPIDGMPQVHIPAGVLRMGGLDIYADRGDEFPAHTVSFDTFWIDKLEVTNAMYMLCVQAGACVPPHDWTSDKRASYFNNEEFKDYPVVNVTWEQAEIYCTWANRRLPTEAEWERAARGDDFRNYPWGDEPPSELYANYNHIINDTTRVGSYAIGASPFGALDMAGNVWEWVADLYGTEYYKISPDHNPTGPEVSNTYLRVIRGGSFQDEWSSLRVSKRGAALGPNFGLRYDDPNRNGKYSSKIGFRCAFSK